MDIQNVSPSIPVTEIPYVGTMFGIDGIEVDLDYLLAVPREPQQIASPILLQQQTANPSTVTQRPIQDRPSIPGPIWLGRCVVCMDRDNEGFLHANEGNIATCGHPLCQRCADQILATTRNCPKCRRTTNRFILVRLP